MRQNEKGSELVAAPKSEYDWAVQGLWVPLLLFLMLLPGWASAQLQRWVDEQGTIHYTAPPGERSLPAPRATRIPFMPGSPILVSARINGGEPVTLILDTGADRTMVAPQALWRLGISSYAGRHRVKGVGGIVEADVVRVDMVEVGEAKAGPLLVIAHDADLKQADGLLGRDFLDQFKVTIDAKESVVILEPRG